MIIRGVTGLLSWALFPSLWVFFSLKTQGHPEESTGVVDSLDWAMDPARHRHLA